MYVPHFIYMLISWWVFELFSFLAVMNNAAVNICLQDLHEYVFSFLLKWNLGVEVLDHKVTMCLTFWRTARQFSKWLHHLHSCQKCMRFLVSLHPNQYMLLSVFMNLALLARTTLSWLPLFCRYSKFYIVFNCVEQLQLHATNSSKFSFHFLLYYQYLQIFLVMASWIHPSFESGHLIFKYMGFCL